jgi:hypothetical protein
MRERKRERRESERKRERVREREWRTFIAFHKKIPTDK